jgi:hypothetical protein
MSRSCATCRTRSNVALKCRARSCQIWTLTNRIEPICRERFARYQKVTRRQRVTASAIKGQRSPALLVNTCARGGNVLLSLFARQSSQVRSAVRSKAGKALWIKHTWPRLRRPWRGEAHKDSEPARQCRREQRGRVNIATNPAKLMWPVHVRSRRNPIKRIF